MLDQAKTGHIRMMIRMISLGLALTLSAPALAQEEPTGPEPKVNQLIVYGDDPCPESTKADEITVCGRLPEGDRYRIPQIFRDNPNKIENQSWAARAEAFETVGRFGTNSCSPVGLGGFTGCTQSLVRAYRGEQTVDNRVDWNKLVAKERQRRLGNIDAEAAAEEARVVAEEEERARRAKAQTSDDDPATAAADAEPLPDPR
jgi:hypothetical protein